MHVVLSGPFAASQTALTANESEQLMVDLLSWLG